VTFDAVRRELSVLAKEAGLSLNNVQIHHLFGDAAKKLGGLAANPWGALDPTGLAVANGNAKTPGTVHHLLHELEERLGPRAAEMLRRVSRPAAATRGAAIASRGFALLKALPAVAGVAISGYQVAKGVAEVARGEHALGAVDVGEGGAGLGLMAAPGLAKGEKLDETIGTGFGDLYGWTQRSSLVPEAYKRVQKAGMDAAEDFFYRTFLK
jgi:hypothetical protein